MKKIVLKTLSVLLLTMLVFTGCRKEIENPLVTPASTPASESESLSRGDDDRDKRECRLTSFAYPGGGETYHYNRRELCDEWNIPGYAVFKQEYDNGGNLIRSRAYDGANLIYTIHFFYTGKKVTKEIWYVGNTNEIYDIVHYIFNHRGLNVRMESSVYDYYTVNTFDAQGNLKTYDFYIDGNHVYSSRLTYNYHPFFKNPSRAIPGIEHAFPFLNAAIFATPECISSEKLIAFDENGDPVVLYDYDPRKTSYRRASQNYPSSGRFFDRVTNDWTSQTFEYENCGRGHDDINAPIAQPSSKSATGRINPMMLLKRHPSKSIKEQVREIRMQLKNKQH